MRRVFEINDAQGQTIYRTNGIDGHQVHVNAAQGALAGNTASNCVIKNKYGGIAHGDSYEIHCKYNIYWFFTSQNKYTKGLILLNLISSYQQLSILKTNILNEINETDIAKKYSELYYQ